MAQGIGDFDVSSITNEDLNNYLQYIILLKRNLGEETMGNYQNSWGADNPGLLVILIDQSGSMEDLYTDTDDKKTVAAQVVNKVIQELANQCKKGSFVSDRCYLNVIGYGAGVETIVGGIISNVSANPLEMQKVKKYSGGENMEIDFPIWIKPKSENGTPMLEAFQKAYSIVNDWIQGHPNCFPPVVFNITDAELSDFQAVTSVAESLKQMNTSDGNVLLMNAHIKNAPYESISVPTEINIGGEEAKFLFNISSIIPENLLEKAIRVGLPAKTGSRAFVYKAPPETLVSLINFGSMGGLR